MDLKDIQPLGQLDGLNSVQDIISKFGAAEAFVKQINEQATALDIGQTFHEAAGLNVFTKITDDAAATHALMARIGECAVLKLPKPLDFGAALGLSNVSDALTPPVLPPFLPAETDDPYISELEYRVEALETTVERLMADNAELRGEVRELKMKRRVETLGASEEHHPEPPQSDSQFPDN